MNLCRFPDFTWQALEAVRFQFICRPILVASGFRARMACALLLTIGSGLTCMLYSMVTTPIRQHTLISLWTYACLTHLACLNSLVAVQILTTTQQALNIVKAFPYMPEQARMVEVIAALHSEAPIAVLTQSEDIDDFDHHVNWQQVVDYLGTIDTDNIHVRVPLM